MMLNLNTEILMNNRVSATNDASAISKYCMCKMGYCSDRYIGILSGVHHSKTKKKYRRSPVIHRGYHLRNTLINESVRSFISHVCVESATSCPSDQFVGQVINLGAGSSSLYFCMNQQMPVYTSRIKFVEIDMPHVIVNKLKIIKNNIHDFYADKVPLKFETLQDNKTVLIGNVFYCCGDLRDVKGLSEVLLSTCTLDPTLPTLVVSETDALIHWIGAAFHQCAFICYEQIEPDDGFGQVMLGHFNSLNSPLLTIHRYPTVRDWMHRLSTLGFEKVSAHNAASLYLKWVTKLEKERINAIEPFDEQSIFLEICRHYLLAVAVKGISLEPWKQFIHTSGNAVLNPHFSTLRPCLRYPIIQHALPTLHRFAHAACIVQISTKRYILMCGGFGSNQNGTHARIGSIILISIDNWKIIDLRISEEDILKFELDRMYACLVGAENKAILIGGRRSPIKASSINIQIQFTMINEVITAQLTQFHTEAQMNFWKSSACPLPNNLTFICGGLDENCTKTNCYLVNTCNNQVLPLPHMPIALHSHSCALINECIYVTGGMINKCSQMNSCIYKFNLTDKTWTNIGEFEICSRIAHQSCSINNRLILIGGTGSHQVLYPIIEMDCIDLKPKVIMCDQLKKMLLIDYATMVIDNQVILLGGGSNCFSFGTKFNENIVLLDLNK